MNHGSDLNWHRSFLLSLAARMKPRSYLELGLGSSPALLDVAGHCEFVYGVDRDVFVSDLPNVTIFTMTTDVFFADMAGGIEPPELVLIDADHNKVQVLRDLQHVAEICAENCIVVLHDTFPGGVNDTAANVCGDSYKVPDMLIHCEHVTIPAPPGVTICRLRPKALF